MSFLSGIHSLSTSSFSSLPSSSSSSSPCGAITNAGWVNSKADGVPTPHPDWFSAVLWRQTVGSRVLSINTSTSPASVNSTLAVHAFCSSVTMPAGAVTLIYINL